MRKGQRMPEEQRLAMIAGKTGKQLSPEHRAKISASSTGHTGWNKGISPSAETRAKQRAALVGRKLSAEHKEKIRAAAMGRSHVQPSPSAATRRKISAALAGRKWSPEYRAKVAKLNENRFATIDECYDAHVQKTDWCWLWIGPHRKQGHGTFWWHGVRYIAHRFAYERANGPIPDGYQIHHLCGKGACQRPSHLQALNIYDHHRAHERVEAS